jgi:predicted nucleic acid-binding protein
MMVVDASALAPAILLDDHEGEAARAAIGTATMHAPEILLPETVSAIRRIRRQRSVPGARCDIAIALLRVTPMTTHGHAPLLDRIWQLRDSCTPYDAAYVALAEALDVPFVTRDRRLAKTAKRTCDVRIVPDGR